MRKIITGLTLFLLISCGFLLSLAPDNLAIIVLSAMCGVIALGYFLTFIPAILFANGFRTACRNILNTMDIQSTEMWIAIFKIDGLFRQKTLDSIYSEYREKATKQKDENLIVSDIDEYINEDMLAIRAWQSLVVQIPGILTGLGILGTFTGLIFGISGVQFSTVDATLESVEVLLGGIKTAFYTSIAGVILSIIFNILYRLVWNGMIRECNIFLDVYHKNVIPPMEEQTRMRNLRNTEEIITLLERIPRNPGYSLSYGESARGIVADQSMSIANEQIMMPQIRAGLKNEEFTFFLQPRVNLANRTIVGAEALARWNHEKLGILTPASFIPIVENNGYIIKLDQYIWEKVCKTIRSWIDAGLRPVPVAINVSKTDILAMDIVAFFEEMLDKYRIPPRLLEIEIAKNCYVQSIEVTRDTEAELRRMGFRVVMDGFDGDYMSINILDQIEADALKVDMRFMEHVDYATLFDLFNQVHGLNLDVYIEGVENAEQVTMLKKAGYTEGQGYYFYKPQSIEDFENIVMGGM